LSELELDACIAQCIHHPSSVGGLLRSAYAHLQRFGQSQFDFYESLDHYFSSNLNATDLAIRYSTASSKISNNTTDTIGSRWISQYSIVANHFLRFSPEQRTSIPYWRGTNLSIYHHPILVGFASHDILLQRLGWGSSYFGSLLASRAKHITRSTTLHTGLTAVILTRHRSKYAHFVRDRLSKLLWLRHILDLNSLNTLICDFPLVESELDCIGMCGFKGKYIFLSQHTTLDISGDIIAFEVCTGVPLLPDLRSFLLDNDYKPAPRHDRIYLTRGADTRRDIYNESTFCDIVQNHGFIPLYLSQLPILHQLLSCISAEYCIGPHGAQLINGILTRKAFIEILPYPYCKSPWSHTMIKLCNSLQIQHIPYFSSQLTEKPDDLMKCSTFRDLTTHPFCSEEYQKTSMFIDFDTLNDFLSLVCGSK